MQKERRHVTKKKQREITNKIIHCYISHNIAASLPYFHKKGFQKGVFYMNHITKRLFALVLLLSASRVEAVDVSGQSFYLGQSAVVVGNGVLEQFNHLDNKQSDEFAAHFSLQLNGGMNFKKSKMANYFFFNGTSSMRFGQVSAAAANANANTDVYSSFFLLPQAAVGAAESWASTLTAAPKISNFTADIRFAADLNNIVEGLYFEANFPIVWTRWDLNLSETAITTTGTTILSPYISPAAAPATTVAPYTSAKTAFQGTLTAGQVQARQFGNINGSQDKVALGDAKVALGYNVLRREDGYLGLAVLGVFNSDSDSANDAKYLGSPVIGTAGRQCVGGRLEGSYRLYESDNNNLVFQGRADVFHAFSSTITRSYDATDKYGVGSRYMLMKEFTTAAAYNSVMKPLINLSTLKAKISIPVLYDVTLALRWTHKNWFADVAYELEGHNAESFGSFVDSFTTTWYGAMAPSLADGNTNPTFLSTNENISGGIVTSKTTVPTVALASATNVLVQANLDQSSGLAPSALTNRVIGDIGYNFENDWNPFLLVGGGAAFANNNAAPCQWEVHASGGITF